MNPVFLFVGLASIVSGVFLVKKGTAKKPDTPDNLPPVIKPDEVPPVQTTEQVLNEADSTHDDGRPTDTDLVGKVDPPADESDLPTVD